MITTAGMVAGLKRLARTSLAGRGVPVGMLGKAARGLMSLMLVVGLMPVAVFGEVGIACAGEVADGSAYEEPVAESDSGDVTKEDGREESGVGEKADGIAAGGSEPSEGAAADRAGLPEASEREGEFEGSGFSGEPESIEADADGEAKTEDVAGGDEQPGESSNGAEAPRLPEQTVEKEGMEPDEGGKTDADTGEKPSKTRKRTTAKATMTLNEPVQAELRPGKNKMGSAVPGQTIIMDDGGRLPLTNCSVSGTVAGLEKRRRPFYSDDRGLTDTYAVWINNVKLDASKGYKASIPGTATLKWRNTAADITGRRLDLTLVISEIEVRSNDSTQQKSQRIQIASNTDWENGKGFLELISGMQSVSDSTGGRVGVRYRVDAKFTYTGTNTVADGKYLFCATDVDQPDKSMNPDFFKDYTGRYRESFQLISGFDKQLYVQKRVMDTEGIDDGPSMLQYATSTGTLWGSRNSDHPGNFRQGFVIATNGGAFSFYWAGSNCGTKILSNYEDVRIRDRNVNVKSAGVISKNVNEYGQAISSPDSTKRTSGSWRSTTMPWKGTATYYFGAKEGYRVTNVNFIYDELKDGEWVRTNHYKGAISSYTFKSSEMDRDYDIEVSTVAVGAVSTTLRASKTLSGRALSADEFEFQLKENGKVIGTARNDASGNVTFSTPRYTYPSGLGKHVYTIVETKGDERNVEYDPHVLTATVNVSLNAKTNKMSTSVSYSGSTMFSNVFRRMGGVRIKKVDAVTNRPLGNAEFGVYDSGGNLVKRFSTNRHGIAALANAELSADDKTYTVAEIEPPKGYVRTSETKTFTLTADGQIADLTGSPFTNEPNPSTVVIKAYKALKGRSPNVGEFTFVLMKEGELVETATNAADKYATFSEMEFTQADAGKSIQYEVHEIVGNDGQIDYDDHYWIVDIEVAADNGKVTTSTNYTRQNETAETLSALPTMAELSRGNARNPRKIAAQGLENPDHLEEAVIDEGEIAEALAAKDSASDFFEGLKSKGDEELLPQSALLPSFVEKAYGDEGERSDADKVAIVDTASDAGDEHGHATLMAQAVKEANPEVEIVFVRAFDENGRATPKAVAAAIREAVEGGAGILNLSFAKYDDGSDASVKEAVGSALEQGVTVVASAGGGGFDASDFLPANIEGVVTVGMLDADGEVDESGNVGECVDVFVEAGSTSEAAAKVSGWLSANSCDVERLYRADGLSFKAKAGMGHLDLVADGEEHYVEVSLKEVPDELKAEYFDVSESTVAGTHNKFNNTYEFWAILGYTVSTNNDTTYKLTLNGYLGKKAQFNGPGSNWKYTLSGTGQTAVSGTGTGTIETSDTKYKFLSSKVWSWTKGTSTAEKTISWKVYRASSTSTSSTATLKVTVPKKTSYTVKYVANGGTSTPADQTKWYGTALTLRGAISHSNTTATGYTVSYDGNGGTPTRTSDTSTKTTKYTFSKWKASNGTQYDAGGSYTANAGTTMTAQWSTSTTNGAVTLPEASRYGYTFSGWTTGSGAWAGWNGESYTPTAATMLYANWTGVKYYVRYDANGGVGTMYNSEHTYGTASNLSGIGYSKDGYSFMGWAGTQEDATRGNVFLSNQALITDLSAGGTVTLYAVWKKDVTISFDGNGAGGYTSPVSGCYYHQNTSVGLKLTSENYSDPTGYSFAGWATSSANAAAGIVSWENGATVWASNSMTLYAVWKRTVTFISGIDRETTRTADQFYPSAVTVPSGNAQIPSWTFAGWREDNVAGAAQHAATGAIRPSSATVNAVYTTNLATTYSANGGEMGRAVDYTEETPATYNSADTLVSDVKVSDVPKPTRDGEDYLFWCAANDGSEVALFAGDDILDLYAPEWTNVTLYAIYEGNEAVFRNTFYPRSGVTLVKTDAVNGGPLAGTKFVIEEVAGTAPEGRTPIGTIYMTTDENGRASTAPDALWGSATYRVREVRASAGYVSAGKTQEFTAIPEQGAVYDIGEWTNEPVRGSAQITASVIFKTQTGREASEPRIISANEFVFDLLDSKGDVVATVRTVPSESGEVELVFPEIEFGFADCGKTHAFMIRQRDLGEPGVTYDSRDIAVTIDVAYEDEHISAPIRFQDTDGLLENVVFENTYTPSYDVAGLKMTAGHSVSGGYDVDGMAAAMEAAIGAESVQIADTSGLLSAMPGDAVEFTANVTTSAIVVPSRTLNVAGIAAALEERWEGSSVELDDASALESALTLAEPGDPISFGLSKDGEPLTLTATRDDVMVIYVIEDGEAIAEIESGGGEENTVSDEVEMAFVALFKTDGSICISDAGGTDSGEVPALSEFQPEVAAMPLSGAELTIFEIADGLASDDGEHVPVVFESVQAFETQFAKNERKQLYAYDAQKLIGECGLKLIATMRTGADGIAKTSGGQLESGKAYVVMETKAPAGYLLSETPTIYIVDDYADNGDFSHMDYVNGAQGVVRHLDEAGNPDLGAGKEARRAYRYEIGDDALAPSFADIDFFNEASGLDSGGVRVAKVDATSGEPLAGAVFEIFDGAEFDESYARWRDDAEHAGDEGAGASSSFLGAMRDLGESGEVSPYFVEPIDSIESGGNGFAESTASSLAVGKTYRIVEVTAPDGYSPPEYDFDNPNTTTAGNWTFTVEEKGALQHMGSNGEEMVFCDAKSTKVGSARIVAHKVLSGATLSDGQFVFALYDEYGGEVAEAANDAAGDVTFDISYDMSQRGAHRYRMMEKSSGDPDMEYDAHEAIVVVEVADKGAASLSCQVSVEDERDLVFYNEAHNPDDTFGSVRALKLDLNDDAPLAGAKFLLEGDNGYFGYLESGEDGIVSTFARSLPVGTYTIKEVEAPEGYKLNEEWSAQFSIEEDGQDVDLTEDPCRDEPDPLVALPLTGGPGAWTTLALAVAVLAACGMGRKPRGFQLIP